MVLSLEEERRKSVFTYKEKEFFAKAQQAKASSSLKLIKLKQVVELTLTFNAWVGELALVGFIILEMR